MPSIMRNNIRYGSSVGGGNEDIVELTQEQYDALGDSVLTDNKTYYITDADDQYNASSVIFDNTDTNLNAIDVQSAIVEQNKKLEQVFQLGVDTKAQLINSLENSGFGLTTENTWEEIITFFKERFPESYYFYKNGDICSDFTNGYVVSGAYSSYSTDSNGELYFYSYKLATNASGNYGYLRTVDKVPIKSGHTKLKCHVRYAEQYYGQVWFYLGTSPTSMANYIKIIDYSSGASSNLSDKTFTIDISSYEGDYYIGLAIASGGSSTEHATVYIDEIWVE